MYVAALVLCESPCRKSNAMRGHFSRNTHRKAGCGVEVLLELRGTCTTVPGGTLGSSAARPTSNVSKVAEGAARRPCVVCKSRVAYTRRTRVLLNVHPHGHCCPAAANCRHAVCHSHSCSCPKPSPQASPAAFNRSFVRVSSLRSLLAPPYRILSRTRLIIIRQHENRGL